MLLALIQTSLQLRLCTCSKRCPTDCNNRMRGCAGNIAVGYEALFSPMQQAHALACKIEVFRSAVLGIYM